MTKTNKIITIFSALFGITFLIMFITMIPKNNIEFTNLPTDTADNALTIQNNDPIYGNENAKLIIYYFGDLTSSSSVKVSKSLIEIADETESIAIVWKDFPNTSLNSESLNSAIAARCAQKQNAFWEYHDYLSTQSNQFNEKLYKNIAKELDLWEWSFDRCFDKEKTLDTIIESYEQGMTLSITAAPTLVIDNQQYIGYLNKSELESIITNALLEL